MCTSAYKYCINLHRYTWIHPYKSTKDEDKHDEITKDTWQFTQQTLNGFRNYTNILPFVSTCDAFLLKLENSKKKWLNKYNISTLSEILPTPRWIYSTYSIVTFPHHPPPKKKHDMFPFLLRSQGTVEYSCGTRCSPSNPASSAGGSVWNPLCHSVSGLVGAS